MKNYKVIFTDLDGTLIDTISGETFPKGIWDMRFNFEVLDRIKELQPLYVFIVSNQGGIEKGLIDQRDFNYKAEYIIRSIREYTLNPNVQYDFCPFNNPENPYRKPNVGMLENLMRRYILALDEIEKEDCLMIGMRQGETDNSPTATKDVLRISALTIWMLRTL